MITDTDITKLKKTFATKKELKKEIADLRTEMRTGFRMVNDRFEEVDEKFENMNHRLEDVNEKVDTIAVAVGQIQNTLDGIAGAIHDQQIENAAGAIHLMRHDRQIKALARATKVTLPD